MPKTLLTEAILTSYAPKVDGSFTLRFTTQDISDEQKMEIIEHYQKFGWLAFRDSEDVTDIELPENDPKREGKSQSQRLRASLYVLMKKKYPDASASEIDDKIRNYTEDLIEKVQNKIEELS